MDGHYKLFAKVFDQNLNDWIVIEKFICNFLTDGHVIVSNH